MGLFDSLLAPRFEKRLAECERVIAAVEKQCRELELDANDLYERCRNMLKKTARERSRIEEATAQPTETPDAATSGGNGRLPQGGMLTERQKEIQQSILRRRGGL